MKVRFGGREIRPSEEVFNEHQLPKIELQAKEGLALINGTQAMTAQGIVNYIEAEKLAYASEWIAAMTMESSMALLMHFIQLFMMQEECKNKWMLHSVCVNG